jgi:hypothetical protein
VILVTSSASAAAVGSSVGVVFESVVCEVSARHQRVNGQRQRSKSTVKLTCVWSGVLHRLACSSGYCSDSNDTACERSS